MLRPSQRDPSSRHSDTSKPAYVTVERLSASYGAGAMRVPVLHDVSFEIDRGESVAIVGPSGSGKTTLLSILGGLDVPQEGRVLVDGQDLFGDSGAAMARHRRERVGFVFQSFNLLGALSALQNVEAGLDPLGLGRRERRRSALTALDEVGLGPKQRRYPHELSGGEQQRVAIARATAKDPSLLLADEPTGNLDDEAGAGVLEILFAGCEASGRRTLILVTHDAAAAARARRVLRLRDRRLHEGEP